MTDGSGRNTPGHDVAAALDAIEQRGGPDGLHAFVSWDRESALAEAGSAAARAGPLAGVPVAVKDNICTLGLPTTCASRILAGYRSPYEATAVRRLRSAGAVVVGKTNMDEFGMGSSTEHSAYGPARNPHDPTRVPGGSSGGSAAAVAAGIVPVALGSDTGGSVRQPAALCGVVGIKPTYGRVSRYGLVAFASSLDQIGTLGRRVRDAARALEVISGPDPLDSTAADRPMPALEEALEGDVDGLVVGVPAEAFPESLDPDVARICRGALERLRAAGARIRELSLPSIRHAMATYYIIAPAEASSNLARYDGVRYGVRTDAGSLDAMQRATRSHGFGPEVKRRIVLGTHVLSAGYHDRYYGRAQRSRRAIAAEYAGAFEAGIDVLFSPTTPTPAFRIGERVDDPYRMYLADLFTVTANLTGLPAASVPVGRVDGLPVGGHLIAAAWAESTLVRASAGLERLLDA